MNLGSLLNAGAKGFLAADDSRNERESARAQQNAALLAALERRRLNESIIGRNDAEAQATLHPQPRARQAHEDYASSYDGLIAAGKSPEDADQETRRRYGRNQEPERSPTYGSPEYLTAVGEVARVRNANRPPPRPRSSLGDHTPSVLDRTRTERYHATLADRAVEAAGGDVNKAAESLVNNPETKDVFVIAGLQREASLTAEGSSHSARVAAWAHLGKHLGMFGEKKPDISTHPDMHRFLAAVHLAITEVCSPQVAERIRQRVDYLLTAPAGLISA